MKTNEFLSAIFVSEIHQKIKRQDFYETTFGYQLGILKLVPNGGLTQFFDQMSVSIVSDLYDNVKFASFMTNSLARIPSDKLEDARTFVSEQNNYGAMIDADNNLRLRCIFDADNKAYSHNDEIPIEYNSYLTPETFIERAMSFGYSVGNFLDILVKEFPDDITDVVKSIKQAVAEKERKQNDITEESTGMIEELEEDVPAPVAKVSEEKPNQQLENILVLASSACEVQNYQEAESYCNKAIEIDATCYKAWFLKAKAVGYSSRRIKEVSYLLRKAIEYAPAEEKEVIKKQAVDEFKEIGMALLTLHGIVFSKNPDDKSKYTNFSNDTTTLIVAMNELLSDINSVNILDEYLKEITNLINQISVDVLTKAREQYTNIISPTINQFVMFANITGNCVQLLRYAITVHEDNDKTTITTYKNLIDALPKLDQNEPEIKKCKEKIQAIEQAIEEKEKAEKERRISEYWSNHKEEKDRLEAEKKELSEKQDKIHVELDNLNHELHIVRDEERKAEKDKLQEERQELFKNRTKLNVESDNLNREFLIVKNEKKKVPSEIEIEKLNKRKCTLQARQTFRAELGWFTVRKKWKKQIDAEIAIIDSELTVLESKVLEEKKIQEAEIKNKLEAIESKLAQNRNERCEINQKITTIDEKVSVINAEIQKKLDAIVAKKEPKQNELSDVTKRIDEIDEEFKKDRKEE